MFHTSMSGLSASGKQIIHCLTSCFPDHIFAGFHDFQEGNNMNEYLPRCRRTAEVFSLQMLEIFHKHARTRTHTHTQPYIVFIITERKSDRYFVQML